jgi:hypothetical protein
MAYIRDELNTTVFYFKLNSDAFEKELILVRKNLQQYNSIL